MQEALRFTLNGIAIELKVDPERRLLWILRTELGLTGTKHGCGRGLCGSCTVLVDGQAERSCRLRAGAVAGKEVTTIEGIARGEVLHALQQAFIDHGGFQCGFCTPGMIVSAAALLRRHPRPTREEIVEGLAGDLCRCGAHQRIVRAVEQAAAAGAAAEGQR